MVLFELLQVLGEIIDTMGKERDLDIGRAGVLLMQFELLGVFRFQRCFHKVRVD
jgi:hypothetical protein